MLSLHFNLAVTYLSTINNSKCSWLALDLNSKEPWFKKYCRLGSQLLSKNSMFSEKINFRVQRESYSRLLGLELTALTPTPLTRPLVTFCSKRQRLLHISRAHACRSQLLRLWVRFPPGAGLFFFSFYPSEVCP